MSGFDGVPTPDQEEEGDYEEEDEPVKAVPKSKAATKRAKVARFALPAFNFKS